MQLVQSALGSDSRPGSPYVCRMIEVSQSVNTVFIVLEYYNGGDLLSPLCESNLSNNGLPEAIVSRMMLDIFRGQKVLKSFGIANLDLSLENVLVENFNKANMRCVVVDLGMCMLTVKRPLHTPNTRIQEAFSYHPGKQWYHPPEYFNLKNPIQGRFHLLQD